jgi:hypothetical protein
MRFERELKREDNQGARTTFDQTVTSSLVTAFRTATLQQLTQIK